MNNEIGQLEFAVVKGDTSGVFTPTDTGMTLAEDVTFEQWREVLKFIQWANRKLSIGLADCITFGNRKFGLEKVKEELERLQFEAAMVKTAMAINNIPTELRFPNLFGEHYVALSRADLTKDKQVEWARIASEQNLSPSQLRLSIAEGEVVDVAAAKALNTGVITVHGIRQQFDIWLRRVGGVEGVMKMEQDFIDEIQGELYAIVVFGQELQERVGKSEAA